MPSHYEDEEEQKALKGSEVANAIEQGAGEFFSNSLRQLQKVRDSETIAGEVVKAGQWLVEGSMENVKASDDPWNLKDEYGSSNPFVNFAQVSTGSTLKGAGHVLRMANAPFWALGQGLGGISEHALGVDPRFAQWTGEIGGDMLLAPKLYASLARRGVALTKLPGLFDVGTGINKANRAIDWSIYGYKVGELPQQVRRAADATEAVKISESLEDFYSRTNRWVQSQGGLAKANIKNWPLYWQNPVTGGIYRADIKPRTIIPASPARITLKSQNKRLARAKRQFKQSSIIQKELLKEAGGNIEEANAKLLADYNKRMSALVAEQTELNNKIPGILRLYSGGKPGSYGDNYIKSTFAELDRLTFEIENLLQGNVYGEHGYYLASEKIRTLRDGFQNNKIGDFIGEESKVFTLGDVKNFHTVFEVKNPRDGSLSFQKVKNLIERVIDSKQNGEFIYPDLVVNYNPKLESQGASFIIRIEDLDSVQIGGSGNFIGREFDRMLYGKAKARFNYSTEEPIKNVEDVKKWLIKQGIIKVDPEPPLQQTPARTWTHGSGRKPNETMKELRKRLGLED